MPVPNYETQLIRSLQKTIHGQPLVCVIGEPPIELSEACMKLLGGSVDVASNETSDSNLAPDIVLDASSESAEIRINRFLSLSPGMPSGGHYIIFTGSSQADHTRGILREHFCAYIDDLHGFHKRGQVKDGFGVTQLTSCINSINFYPDLIVLEVVHHEKPKMVYTGEPQF